MATILKEPNEILHKKCEPVTDFKEAQQIAKELLEIIRSIPVKYLIWNRWIGFAANQIGYSKRIIGLRRGKDRYEILVNTIIIEKRFPLLQPESCFSLRKHDFYLVKRYLWAKVQYRDLEGKSHEIILRGPNAIYQEMDHIDGKMISDIGFRIF